MKTPVHVQGQVDFTKTLLASYNKLSPYILSMNRYKLVYKPEVLSEGLELDCTHPSSVTYLHGLDLNILWFWKWTVLVRYKVIWMRTTQYSRSDDQCAQKYLCYIYNVIYIYHNLISPQWYSTTYTVSTTIQFPFYACMQRYRKGHSTDKVQHSPTIHRLYNGYKVAENGWCMPAHDNFVYTCTDWTTEMLYRVLRWPRHLNFHFGKWSSTMMILKESLHLSANMKKKNTLLLVAVLLEVSHFRDDITRGTARLSKRIANANFCYTRPLFGSSGRISLLVPN